MEHVWTFFINALLYNSRILNETFQPLKIWNKNKVHVTLAQLIPSLPAQLCPPFNGIWPSIQANHLQDDSKELFQSSHLLHHRQNTSISSSRNLSHLGTPSDAGFLYH